MYNYYCALHVNDGGKNLSKMMLKCDKVRNFRGYLCLLFVPDCIVMFHCPKPQFPIMSDVFPETGGRGGRHSAWCFQMGITMMLFKGG